MSVQEMPRIRGQSPQERSQRGQTCSHTRICVTVTQKGGHRVTGLHDLQGYYLHVADEDVTAEGDGIC